MMRKVKPMSNSKAAKYLNDEKDTIKLLVPFSSRLYMPITACGGSSPGVKGVYVRSAEGPYKSYYQNGDKFRGESLNMAIDDYDWDLLYDKAECLIAGYVPNARVSRGIKTFVGSPRVEVTFPQKGNKNAIEQLEGIKCFRKLIGSNVNGVRLYRGEVIINAITNIQFL